MLFVRSPHDIYHDIFFLVKLGFSAEYIETISPSERGVFKSYHEMEEDAKRKRQNKQNAEDVGLDIEDL